MIPSVPSLTSTLRLLLGVSAFLLVSTVVWAESGETQAPVVFTGGHETEGVDRGRPVSLVAGALGVEPQVFRDAFSQVHPAPPGSQPEPEQVRKNKAALMSALGKYGVTNDRLDTVSNRYRYRKDRGEMWPVKAATAYAVIKNGAVVKYVVTDGGYGYSSAPTATVPSLKGIAPVAAQIGFNREFEKNGAVVAVAVGK